MFVISIFKNSVSSIIGGGRVVVVVEVVVVEVVVVLVVVGGGIRTPEDAKNLVDSGASVIVTGGAIEQDREKMRKFSDAIHVKF